jgi:hypothetical protein
LDQVEEDLKKMKVRNWREKCKDRRLWNEIVKQAKTHPGLWRRVKKRRRRMRNSSMAHELLYSESWIVHFGRDHLK